MIFSRYRITLPYSGVGTTGSTSTSAFTQTSKYITLPINLQFTPVGVGEGVDRLVNQEVYKSVNPTYDGEQIKYKSPNTQGYDLTFRFYNEMTNTFVNDYAAAGFDLPTDYGKNNFRNSYFRLYFYDTNEPQNRNLLFFEEVDIFGTITPSVNLSKIYWLRNDELFKTTNQNRTVYMIGRFFNAKTGKIHEFINTPLSVTSPVTISQFSNNSSWWTSPLLIVNPKNNNGEYQFGPVSGVGANTISSITLTEQIIQ